MLFHFALVGEDREELDLMDDFCTELLESMKTDISNVVFSKRKILPVKERQLLNSSWINWYKKPDNIDIFKLMMDGIELLRYTKVKEGSYILDMDNTMLFYGSRTPIEKMIRFVDKGNDAYPGLNIFNRIFQKYHNQINDYWESFIYQQLNRLSVNEVVIVK